MLRLVVTVEPLERVTVQFGGLFVDEIAALR
jgi:hypothetical protein